MHSFADSIRRSAADLGQKIPFTPETMLVLGSGLNDLILTGYELIKRVPYDKVLGLISPTVPSHKGEFQFLQKGDRKVVICAGRHHLYEGHSAQMVCQNVYMLGTLGVKNLIITNAAGGLNPDYQAGDVMLISDHINTTGHNPVLGQDDSFGLAFPDMSQAYHPSLLSKALKAAESRKVDVHQGIYVGVLGPSLETSAERRMLRSFGADAVGMSTVLEVIAANHCGMQVLGISAITNKATGGKDQQVDTLEAVLHHARIASAKVSEILDAYLAA